MIFSWPARTAHGTRLPPTSEESGDSHKEHIICFQEESIFRMTEPVMFLPMDSASHTDIVKNLTAYPLEFVRNGATDFIHAQSYGRRRPSSLDLIQDICHLRIRHLSNPSVDAAMIEKRRESALLSTANSAISFVDTLAFVQSLCLLQIMLLFSSTSTQEEYTRGEMHLSLLVEWTHKLWETAPSALPSSLSKHEAYVFAEAVRRTIIISHKIQGCHRVSRTGFFRLTIFVGESAFWRRLQPLGRWGSQQCDGPDISEVNVISRTHRQVGRRSNISGNVIRADVTGRL